jgi:cytoskeletal protein CcmA (bactofilin family)
MQPWALAAPAAGLLLSLTAGQLESQQRETSTMEHPDTVPARGLSREASEAVLAFLNHPGTLLLTGEIRVPGGSLVSGNVGVLGGPLVVAGRIEGDVVVLDGDLELLAGGEVDGRVTLVGGHLLTEAGARITGQVDSFAERLTYQRRGGFLVHAHEVPGPPLREVATRRRARSPVDLLIASDGSYNRVEGLPIAVGPVLSTGGSHPFRARALAIYRTESGTSLDADRMGFRLLAEQTLVPGGALRVGAKAYSVVDPIEDWQLRNLETSLATFLLHQDHRDYYERRGWAGYIATRRPGSPLSLVLEGRSERHLAVPAGSPWALFRNQESWRPQPLAAEGRVSIVDLSGRYDTRSSEYDPATGWYVSGRLERGVRSTLRDADAVVAGPLPIVDPEPVPGRGYGAFTTGLLDVRRYNRLSPDSRLNLRLVVGGSLDGRPLPPQRQHALGGEGSLPGYPLFRMDCGARQRPVYRAHEASAPVSSRSDVPPLYVTGYGCDEFALVQAEYRGKLNLRLGWDGGDGSDGWDLAWAAAPEWVAFLDAGRGWSAQRTDEETGVNLGAGLLFHRFGVFTAVPLRGEGGLNLFVRLGPRF